MIKLYCPIPPHWLGNKFQELHKSATLTKHLMRIVLIPKCKKKKGAKGHHLPSKEGRIIHWFQIRVICNHLILGHGFLEIRIQWANDWSMIKQQMNHRILNQPRKESQQEHLEGLCSILLSYKIMCIKARRIPQALFVNLVQYWKIRGTR